MANLQFLRGLQANLDNLSSVQDGAFYLTEDTHRLYVGQGTELVELNKSVTIVETLADLPSSNIKEGQFYYVSGINVLCVYKNGDWVQINPDTRLKEVTTAIQNKNKGTEDVFDTGVEITDTFIQTSTDGNDSNPTNTKSFEAINLKVEAIENDTVLFTGDTYQVNTPAKSNIETEVNGEKIITYNKEAEIELQRNVAAKTGDEAVVKDVVKIVGNTGITSITTDESTQTITIVPTVNEEMSNECDDEDGTITIRVKETEGGSELTTSFTPSFQYGKEKTAVHFKNDNEKYLADFDVYTIDEIDDIIDSLDDSIKENIRANNAMTYKGSMTSFINIETSLPKEEVSNGDVWMLATPEPVVLLDGTIYKPGDFFIASGTENEDGYIPEDQLTWNYIPAGNDTYVTGYDAETKAFQILDGQNSNDIVGSVNVIQGTEDDDDIIVVPNSVKTSSGDGVEVTYTIKHKSQDSSEHGKETNADQIAAGTNGQKIETEIPVIDSLAVDSNGHVTQWDVKTVKLVDSHNRIDADNSDLTIAATGTDKKSVELSTLLAMTDGDTKTYTYSIKSEATNIELDTTGDNSDVKVSLVWGTF